MPDHVLDGCRPSPLAHYLKALGLLRLVAEQADPDARGAWNADRFVLRTRLSAAELDGFLLERYRPTPLLAPWNGGSGFYPKDAREAIEAIGDSAAERLEPYRESIAAARDVLATLGIGAKVDKDGKAILLEACRARMPDRFVEWLDAAVLLTGEGLKYPPLLGTGGNDGRLEFTNNFMQRLLDLMDPETGAPRPAAAALLGAALRGDATGGLTRGAAIGMYLPGDAGGANAADGFGDDSLVNPWDFVLMLEGAVVFAAAAVRRLPHETTPGALSAPFTVRPVAAGYGSAAPGEEASARAELWLPLWERPASAAEVGALFAEGRAEVGGRAAVDGVDFALAVTTLGVDRGIRQFVRCGFHVRNGLAYFAVPLDRLTVRGDDRVTLLLRLHGWLDQLRSRAPAGPASVARAARRLDEAVLELCRQPDSHRLLEVMVALGRCQHALGRSLKWTLEKGLRPMPRLSRRWLALADDGSVELRLAAALASVTGRYGEADGKPRHATIREQLEPVTTELVFGKQRSRWKKEPGRDVVGAEGSLVDALHAVLHRRLLLAVRERGTLGPEKDQPTAYTDTGRLSADLDDVADFVADRVDDRRLADLLRACLPIDWRLDREERPRRRGAGGAWPTNGLYALLKLCFAGRQVRDVTVPLVPRIHRLAAAGDAAGASAEAARRLRGSGLPPAVDVLHGDGDTTRRVAAALLFPLSTAGVDRLAQQVLRPRDDEETPTPAATNSQGVRP
jgi:CRISPR-associated protein Csx17